MQAFVFRAIASAAAALAVMLGAAAPTRAVEPGPATTQSPSPAPASKPLGDMSMDELFATLADPANEPRGRAAEKEIQRRWSRSGSATVDLLMSWAQQSLAAKEYGRALDFLDQVVMLKPDYAEGWNRRATVFYLQDEYGKALSDIEKVLILEPRHFGALAGIGTIFEELDRKADALAAFEKALAIDPYLDDDVRKSIDQLKPDVEGEQI